MGLHCFFSPAETADLRREFLKPQITRIAQIFNKLQIVQIERIDFLEP